MRFLNILMTGWAVIASVASFPLASCTPDHDPIMQEDEEQETVENTETENERTFMKVKITAGGKTFTADIEDTETGKAFFGKLPLTLDMSELNGNEKYCYGVSLPKNDKRYDSIATGDIMLYNGDCIVLFYGSAGGYNYTRIGKIADTSGLASSLGNGKITVRFEKQ